MATLEIELPNGQKVVFGCTHLDAQKVDTNRLLQIKKIVEIAKAEQLPFIIAGDFNATPEDGPVIEILDKNLERTCQNCAPTIPVNNSKKP